MDVEHGVDLYRLMDVAEDLVVPRMDTPARIDRDALILGYAGVYSSFLLFAQRVAAKYGPSSRDVLVVLGHRKTARAGTNRQARSLPPCRASAS
jgi:4-hydroxy-2-oxovalerate/4-hydroxy-2-oxohexanoate aldolase